MSATAGMQGVTLTGSLSRQAGGFFVLLRGLNQALLRRGVTMQVVGLADAFAAEDVPSWLPLQPRVLPVVGPPGIGYAPSLTRVLDDVDAAWIHAHGLWMYPSLANARWSRRHGRPYLVSPQGMLDPWALAHSRWKKRLAAWAFESGHLRGAACMHAVAESEADSIRRFGLRNPIALIPNGIELPPGPSDAPAPWAEALPGCRHVLLFLGRLHPKKGLVALLDAWAQISRDLGGASREWGLAIAGWDQGGFEARLRDQVQTLAIARNVTFCGPLHGEAKAAAFSRASAFVLPSFSEGMPAAVLEAWSYGLPVVMTPACNIPEGFASEAAVEVGTDPASVVRGLTDLIRMSAGERARLGQNGRALVEARFTWDCIAEQTQAVYEWIVGGGDPPACVRLARA